MRIKKLLSFVLVIAFALPLICCQTAAEDVTLSVKFSSSAVVSSCSATNGNAKYFANENAVRIIATGNAPSITFGVDGYDPSYAYGVITYRFPATNSTLSSEGTVELISGGNVKSSKNFCYAVGYKYYSTIVKLGSVSADSVRIKLMNECQAGDIVYISEVSFFKTESGAEKYSKVSALAANGETLSKYTENALKTSSYVWSDYMIPYWDTDLIINEGVYPLQNKNGTMSDITLMFDADRIISVRSSTLSTEYKEGVDYELADGKLRILQTGSIPCVKYTDHYFTSQKSNSYRIRGTSNYVRFQEGPGIPSVQLAVTYTHSDSWSGYMPENQGEALPNTLSKLENGKDLKIVFFGDSITNGGNSSGEINMAPYAERWTVMFEKELKSLYPSANISCTNTSVSGGSWTPEAVDNVQNAIIDYSPDLVVLALGTNDYQFQYSASSTYQSMSYVVDQIKSKLPNCEIILVAPMLSNPECFDPDLLDEYIAGYRQKASEYSGVVIADVNAVHKYLLTRKSYTDMSANNLCHLNDTLARTYAHVLIKTVTPSSLSDAYKQIEIERLSGLADPNSYFDKQRSVISDITSEASSAVMSASSFNEAEKIYRDAKIAISSVPDKSAYIKSTADYSNLVFDSSNALRLFSSTGYMTLNYSQTEKAVSMTATGSNKDMHTTLVFDKTKPVSATSNKYAVLTYKVPSSMSAASPVTQLFFSSGNISSANETTSVSFTAEKGSSFRSRIIDLSEYSWWGGIISRIRIDPFKASNKGDAFYLYSLCFCETASEASNISSKMADRANGVYHADSAVTTFDNEGSLSYITPPYITLRLGDVNCDKRVNSRDIAALKRYMASEHEPEYDSVSFDVNRDGKRSAHDLSMLKRIVAGSYEGDYDFEYDALCTEFDISFNATDNTAAVSRHFGHFASFHTDAGFDDPQYAVLIYKVSTDVTAAVYLGNNLINSAKTDAAFKKSDGFESLIIELPDGYEGSYVTVDIADMTLSASHFAVFADRASAEEFVAEKTGKTQDPGDFDIDYSENVTFSFSDNTLDLITYVNHTSYEVTSIGELKLTVAENRIDPFVYFDLSSLNISANEYKYIIYTYKVSSGASERATRGQIFFCSGSSSVPAESSSVIFDLTRSGGYESKIFDLSGVNWWGGDVYGLRFDYFCDASLGDVCTVNSVTFCKTEADVASALENN
ncbi:MAG: hypothetical protein IJS45_10300 [Clostridia bacterium]|nr:hypothetical protein [Clostridia bacterium]